MQQCTVLVKAIISSRTDVKIINDNLVFNVHDNATGMHDGKTYIFIILIFYKINKVKSEYFPSFKPTHIPIRNTQFFFYVKIGGHPLRTEKQHNGSI